MNLRAACLIFGAFLLAACGIQRPLVRPADIPEYERKREEKLRKRQIEPQQQPQAAAARQEMKG